MTDAIESLLEADHASLAHLLTDLDTELANRNVARSYELLDRFWARLAVHIRAENLHLFPILTNVPASLFIGKGGLPTSEEARDLLLRLRSDHNFFMKELAQTIKTMRGIASDPPARLDEIEEVRRRMKIIEKRLEVHNRLEEEQAYTWPVLLFDASTVASLIERLQHELENVPLRFA